MVETGGCPKNIFRQVEQIHISYIHYQAHGYFGLLGIGNVGNIVLKNSLVLSYLQKFNGDQPQVHNIYARMRSYMISKSNEVSITKTSLKKLRLH